MGTWYKLQPKNRKEESLKSVLKFHPLEWNTWLITKYRLENKKKQKSKHLSEQNQQTLCRWGPKSVRTWGWNPRLTWCSARRTTEHFLEREMLPDRALQMYWTSELLWTNVCWTEGSKCRLFYIGWLSGWTKGCTTRMMADDDDDECDWWRIGWTTKIYTHTVRTLDA